jgi:hypothetical protein
LIFKGFFIFVTTSLQHFIVPYFLVKGYFILS